MSLQQVAEAVGTNKSQIDKLERGERRLTVEWMVRIGRALDCDPRDLMNMEKWSAPVRSQTRPCKTAIAATVPVLSAARGGKDQQMFLSDGPIDQAPRPHYMAETKGAYAIYVVGNSMAPMYRPRQLLFINPYKPPVAGSGVVITKRNGAVLIKEFVRQKAGMIVVREYNPAKRDFPIPTAEIDTVHAVAGAQEPA